MVSDHKRIDGFLQGARSLQLLGLNHILLLSLTQSECKLIRDVVPEVGCGWTTSKALKTWKVFMICGTCDIALWLG